MKNIMSANLYAKKMQLKHNSSIQLTISIKQNASFDLIVCNEFSRSWQKTCMWCCTLMTFIPLSCIRKEKKRLFTKHHDCWCDSKACVTSRLTASLHPPLLFATHSFLFKFKLLISPIFFPHFCFYNFPLLNASLFFVWFSHHAHSIYPIGLFKKLFCVWNASRARFGECSLSIGHFRFSGSYLWCGLKSNGVAPLIWPVTLRWKCTFCHLPSRLCQTRVSSDWWVCAWLSRSIYCVKRTYAMHAASSPNKCTCGFNMVVLIALQFLPKTFSK